MAKIIPAQLNLSVPITEEEFWILNYRIRLLTLPTDLVRSCQICF